MPTAAVSPMTDEERQRVRRVLEALVGVPATEGNAVEVYRNGAEIFPAMLEAIRASVNTVDFLTFIYWSGDPARWFADALSERAACGVRVRVLLDAIGARIVDRGQIERMRAAGVTVEWFRPPTTWKVWHQNHRTHRKVLVCDERVAFTGGVGIAEEWDGDARDETEWRDTHFRVEGPAVDGLRAAFATNWAETGHPLFDERDRFPDQPKPGDACVQVVRGAADIAWTDMATVFRTVIMLAKRRLRIATAYFNPDEMFVGLLRDAAARGVDVTVLAPGPHADKRIVQIAAENDYQPLLDAGVRIWNYQRSMLHTKILTMDGTLAIVGSANFNERSMRLDEEVVMAVLNDDLVTTLDRHFDEDLASSEEINESRWRRRGVLQRTKERAVGIIDSQM